MGCDIHPYIEVKYPDCQLWWLQGEFNIGRDYQLFGLLAGVRCPCSPVVQKKGPPVDMSPELNEKYLVEYDHSASWLTLKEVDAVIKEYRRLEPENMLPGFLAIRALMAEYAAQGVDVRLVFWFDS